MNFTPLPATLTPASPPASVNPHPPSPGQGSDAMPGGFARLLDQAREEPEPSTAGHDSPVETDKPTRTTRSTRPGAARTTAATAGEPGSTPPAAAQTETAVAASDAVDTEKTSVATDAAPPASGDGAALLAALAAFTRPPPAPASTDGPAARTNGDKEDEAAARARGNPAPPRAAPTAPGGPRLDGLTAASTGAAPAAAAHAASTVAGAGLETPAAAEKAASAGGRSFAAELQAGLPPAATTTAMAAMAGATAPLATAAGSAPAAPPPSLQGQIAASPGSPLFAPELGATLATFVRDGVQHARLELHPAEMGPLTVQIQLDGQAAQIHLSAHNADTREALEQAMPQLAGSLREAGLTLSGGGVFEQPRQPQSQDPASSGSRRSAGEHDGEKGVAQAEVAAKLPGRRRGVVDLVA